MQDQQRAFQAAALHRAVAQHLDAGHLQVGGEQSEQREEQRGLMPGDKALEPAPAEGRVRGPDEHLGRDVWVEVVVVGVVVVTGVLIHPPAVAHPDREVSGDPSGELAGALGAEHLAVCQVVRHERDLSERDGKEHGRHQLPPGRADEEKRGPTAEEHERDDTQPCDVVGGPALHQPLAADPASQHGEVAAGRCPRRRHGDRHVSIKPATAWIVRSATPCGPVVLAPPLNRAPVGTI